MRSFAVDENLFDVVSRSFPGVQIKVDTELSMHGVYVPKIGVTKLTTVRFGHGLIRIPLGNDLPLFETSPVDSLYKRPAGRILIPAVAIKTYG